MGMNKNVVTGSGHRDLIHGTQIRLNEILADILERNEISDISPKPQVKSLLKSQASQPQETPRQPEDANTKLSALQLEMQTMLADPALTESEKQTIRAEIAKIGIMQVRLNNQRPGDKP